MILRNIVIIINYKCAEHEKYEKIEFIDHSRCINKKIA